jgi:hypothetical protein
MKTSSVLGYLFVALMGAVIGALLFYSRVPDGKVIVDKSSVDSLNAFIRLSDSIKTLSDKPIITHTDTIYVEKEVYIATSTIVANPNNSDSDSIHYNDSLLVKDEVAVWVDFYLKGYRDKITLNWKYKPIVRNIETITEKPIYYPVVEAIEVEKSRFYTGHYLSLAAGGNAKMFNFGIDYTIIKEDWIYGLEYRRYGSQNVYGFQVGYNLRSLFKKND